jgi:heat shock protein HslJ
MKTTLLLAMAMTALAACGAGPGAGDGGGPFGEDATGLDAFGSNQWMLIHGTVDGSRLMLIDTHAVTVALTPEGLGGTSACNSYFGSISADGDTLVVSDLGSTMMACVDEGVMDLESAFLGAMQRVTAATRSGGGLSLTGDGVVLEFTPVIAPPDAELEGTDWVLTTLIDGETATSVAAATGAAIRLEEGSVSGSTGCNRLNGTATLADGRLVIDGLATTRMACEGVMEQEAFVLAVLGGRPTVSIDGAALTLTLGDGRALGYSVG